MGFEQVFMARVFAHISSTSFTAIFTIVFTHTKLTFSYLLNGLFSTTSTATITRINKFTNYFININGAYV